MGVSRGLRRDHRSREMVPFLPAFNSDGPYPVPPATSIALSRRRQHQMDRIGAAGLDAGRATQHQWARQLIRGDNPNLYAALPRTEHLSNI